MTSRPTLVLLAASASLILLVVFLQLPKPDQAERTPAAAAAAATAAGAAAPQQQQSMPFGAFAFEVHGRVQGVWFRKFTVAKAQALHLVGWCANTQRGTVMGECQGNPQDLQVMKEWLCTEGSPQSHIERCVFKQERDIEQLDYQVFERRANVP